jgi:hypothetical protein
MDQVSCGHQGENESVVDGNVWGRKDGVAAGACE